MERKEGKRNLTSKSSHVTNTISGDERQCPVSGYQTEIIASSLYSLKDLKLRILRKSLWNFYAFSLFLFSKNNFRFFSDYLFLSFCIWRNLVAGLRGRTSRRSRLVFATPKGCRPRYLVDTSIKIKRVSGPTHFQRRIYMLFVFYHRQEIVI